MGGANGLLGNLRIADILGMSALGRSPCCLTGNLVSSPAPDRVPVRACLKRRPGLALAHRFGVATAWAECTSVRRIERIGKLAPCRRERCAA